MAKKHRNQGDILAQDPNGEVTVPGAPVLSPEVLPAEEESFPESTPETDAIRSQIQNIADHISQSYWELSALVYNVNTQRLYRTWGFEKFEDWAQAELGFERRKAFYLVQFQEYCNEDLKKLFPKDDQYQPVLSQIKEIGWSKALEIAKSEVLTEDNFEEVLSAARADTISAFATKLKLFKAGEQGDEDKTEDGNTMKSVRLSFKITTAQEEVVQCALVKAKKLIGKDKTADGTALEYICADFDANAGHDLNDVLSRIERTMGVNIVAFSGDAKAVLFNAEFLTRLASEADNSEVGTTSSTDDGTPSESV